MGGTSSDPPSRHQLARAHLPSDSSPAAAMQAYRKYRDHVRQPFLERYSVLGFLSSGTYGKVYKARIRRPEGSEDATTSLGEDAQEDLLTKTSRQEESDEEMYAIKKFKPDKEVENPTYTGISQSAMREIALNRELRHENIVRLREVMLEDKAIYMVFSYAEHDFLQLIHHHSTVLRTPIPLPVLKSLLYQLLQGVAYLHANWVLHRDLKPANILITSQGQVKIGDLGLARVYSSPLLPLYNADKVVVTIWYRAPELLLGARHYTPAIDLWAVGCIWGELLALRPMFKGEEAKMDPKTKSAPFQSDQLTRIVEVMGTPTTERWPALETMPEYKTWWPQLRVENHRNHLLAWYATRSRPNAGDLQGFSLFESLLQYDPERRFTAEQALRDPWWTEKPIVTKNAFADIPSPGWQYPARRLLPDDTDAKMAPQASNVALMQQNLLSSAAAAQRVKASSQNKSSNGSSSSQQRIPAINLQHTDNGLGSQGVPDTSKILASAVATALASNASDLGSRGGADDAARIPPASISAAQQLSANLLAMPGNPNGTLGAGSAAETEANLAAAAAAAAAAAVGAAGNNAPSAAILGAAGANPNLGLLNPNPSGPPAPPAAPVSAAPSVGSAVSMEDGVASSVGNSGGNNTTTGTSRGKGSKDMRSAAASNAQRNAKRQKME